MAMIVLRDLLMVAPPAGPGSDDVGAWGAHDGLPGPEVWLVLRRSRDEDAPLKTYLANAPRATPPATFVRLAAGRWPVEHAIKEGKSEVGMDH